jgi:NADH-quinone oxidoreductase subunit C
MNALDTLREQMIPAAGAATLSHGTLVFVLAPGELTEAVRRLRDEFGFDLFLDVTAVDAGGGRAALRDRPPLL